VSVGRLSGAGTVSKRMDVSPHFLTFWYGRHSSFWAYRHYKILRGTPSPGALNVWGWGTFFKYCHISRKRYEIGNTRPNIIGSHRWPIDPCRFQWPWPWGVKIFWQIYIITLERFDLEWQNLAWKEILDHLHARTRYEEQQPSFAWWSRCGENLYTIDNGCWCAIYLR